MPFNFFQVSRVLSLAFLLAGRLSLNADPVASFDKEIKPLLKKYCADCHEDGMKKGNVAFDEFKSERELVENHDLWARALKNVRMGLMPPQKKKERPGPEEIQKLAHWVKQESFHLDPTDPDPGR